MKRQANLGSLILLGCFLLSGIAPVAGQEPGVGQRIRASDVVLPADVKPGDYQRITRPFENWPLVCDENLKARTRVCNVSQTIEDATGKLLFNWSLAATKDGKPYMLLRTAPEAKTDGPVSLKFEGREAPVDVRLDGCNGAVCVGMLPVGPVMREQISKNAAPTVAYVTRDGRTIVVTATLKGLSSAVRAIK